MHNIRIGATNIENNDLKVIPYRVVIAGVSQPLCG
jgi:hypothetical protein